MTGVWPGRIAAGLSLGCALGHGAVAWAGLRAGNLALVGVALGMAVLCLPCAARLWRGPTPGVWRMTAVMSGVMLGLHSSLMVLSGHDHSLHWPVLNVASAALLAIAALGAALSRPRPRRPSGVALDRERSAGGALTGESKRPGGGPLGREQVRWGETARRSNAAPCVARGQESKEKPRRLAVLRITPSRPPLRSARAIARRITWTAG